jgi:hypothetical protein
MWPVPDRNDSFGDASIVPIARAGRLVCHERDYADGAALNDRSHLEGRAELASGLATDTRSVGSRQFVTSARRIAPMSAPRASP